MLKIQSTPIPGFERVLPPMIRLGEVLNVKITLIGAGARNVWLELGGNAGQARATRDVDFALFATDQVKFNQAIRYLTEVENFSASTKAPYSVISIEGIPLDLLPYGPICSGKEVVLEGQDSPLRIEGLQQACESAVEVQFRNEHLFSVIPPAALLMLKMIAYNDRPTHRSNDLDDISMLLVLAYELFLEDIQENHWDIINLYNMGDDFPLLVGSHYLGRKISQVARGSESLQERMKKLLHQHMEFRDRGPIQRTLYRQFNLSSERCQEGMAALQSGFEAG